MTKRRDFLRAEFRDELFADLVLDGVAQGFAVELAGREQRGDETVAGERFRIGKDFVGDDLERDVALFLADLCGEFLLRGDHAAG